MDVSSNPMDFFGKLEFFEISSHVSKGDTSSSNKHLFQLFRVFITILSKLVSTGAEVGDPVFIGFCETCKAGHEGKER